MRRPRISPETYRRITFVAALLVAAIIVSGGAVRLTGSGLGCPDWPNCEPGRLTPRGATDAHAMIEFVNRVFTGAVSVAVIVAVLGSLWRVPRRRDLVWCSVGLVAGVLAQIVLGGLAVVFDLRPPFVMAHFLLSLVLLTDAIVLHVRAGRPDTPARPVVARPVVLLGRLLLLVAAVVVTTGTVVTSTGPHGGDERAKRWDFSLPAVARIHGSSVMLFLALTLAVLYVAHRTRAPRMVADRITVLLVAIVAQAAIGYAQYFNDIPPLLVGMHIAGATAVWSATVWLYLGCFEATPEGVVARPADASSALAAA